MEGESAVQAVYGGGAAGAGSTDAADAMRADYEHQLDAKFAAARGFVDAIVTPEETRDVLTLLLETARGWDGPHLGPFVLPGRVCEITAVVVVDRGDGCRLRRGRAHKPRHRLRARPELQTRPPSRRRSRSWLDRPTRSSPRVAFSAVPPLGATGVDQFRAHHPTYDGRGVLIGILDSGVDPGVDGLNRTTEGSPKVLDVRDFAGEGAVSLRAVTPRLDGTVRVEDRTLMGAGRIARVTGTNLWYAGTLHELTRQYHARRRLERQRYQHRRISRRRGQGDRWLGGLHRYQPRWHV
jgi:hypothetical protein